MMQIPTRQVWTIKEMIADWYARKLYNFMLWRIERARRKHKCRWRCYRDGGGGRLVTPIPMTEARAVAWVGKMVNGEVFHVDFENRMIFYRSHK